MTHAATDHYRRLGVEHHADFKALKRAYYQRAKECHPDLFGGDRAKEEEFKLLVQAFDVLSDPEQRRRYDARMAWEPVAGSAFSSTVSPPAMPLSDEDDPDAILDSRADDILEELIVGNTIARNATLRTLMLDLEITGKFCLFREAKYEYAAGHLRRAHLLFAKAVAGSPGNLLYRYFLAQTHQRLGHHDDAIRQLEKALALGRARQPPMRLNRIRRELSSLRQRQGGLLDGLKEFLLGRPAAPELMKTDEDMRRELGRAMNRLARTENRKRLN